PWVMSHAGQKCCSSSRITGLREIGAQLRAPLRLRSGVRVFDDQRRMVREAFLLVDRHRGRLGSDAERGDVIVDAPSDVLGPGLAAVAPPGILLGPVVDAAMHVDVADFIEYPR